MPRVKATKQHALVGKSGNRRNQGNQKNMAKVAAVMKEEMALVKRGDQSMVAAIRKVAKRLRSVRRIEIEAVLAKKPFKLNVGTVRRQIQEGRAK